MSPRCSICRHPESASIDVSLLRDGIRSTARQYQVSRPALDRHKRHLPQTVAADQARKVIPGSDGATSLFSQLELMIRHCETALSHFVVVRHSGDPGAYGIAPHQPGSARCVPWTALTAAFRHLLEDTKTYHKKNVPSQPAV